MKKALFILTILTGLAFSGKAQLQYFGIKTGIAFTSMGGGSLGTHFSDLGGTGLIAGFSYDYFFNDYLSFAPELIYFRKGTEFFKDSSVSSHANRTDIYKLNYFQLPLTLKIKYPFDMFNIYGLVGPYVSYLFSGKASEEGYAIIGKREMNLKSFFSEQERNQKFSRFDVGFNLGAGAEIDAGSGRITFQLRYDIGFIPVAKDQEVDFEYMSFGSNRAWSIEAGYAIRID